MKDYYEVLNVEKNASDDEIKRAYRTMAKKHHPDLNPNNSEAEQTFKEVSNAYEILSDPTKRSNYDRYGHAGVNPGAAGGAGFGGFGDIFEDIFDIFGGGFSGSSSRRTGPARGSDLRYNLNIEFKEAIFGVEKEIKIRRTENCSTCDGNGAEPGTSKSTCGNCNGRGEVQYAQQTPFGQFVRTGTCDVCNGLGEIIEKKCHTCGGSGKEVKEKTIKIKVPAGVDNDSVISMRGEGEAGQRGGPAGDLYIYLNYKEDKVFERNGNNIYLNIPITFTEASLGAEIQVPTLEDIEEYTIPEGTQNGTKFKIKHMGVPYLRGVGRGDLVFTVNIQVPTKLNEEQKQMLLNFAIESGEVYKEPKQHKKKFFDKVKDVFN